MYVDLERGPPLTDYDLRRREARRRWKRGKLPGAERCQIILAGGYRCPAVAVAVDHRSGKRGCLGHLWAPDTEN